ncbi:putative 5-formyltetrahydrofolate cyclo-ligase [Tritonibacter multivorans]|uniref:5-formyltetrahydrofolate cyclo-ligase n=1 Tax=Tritonibacter multivorans TaxID=928856 RepID=A0A0P1GGM6_9RHOB|nr:5-formyltetrahydrofolate cyclo-ligase [Tritonibacter multivorans]MDA7420734.1 5-formyltetrahydrofolate cyclo-ligase [Tritonibacter multivorans]CUH81048.1 putative 5-formyltetrahydrofolate cyclo-ligase [Tritonibacter multivorans]SFC26690.1 5-formyltetrahydrofolate cyclo-ligase [Tritonibacter multivorans]
MATVETQLGHDALTELKAAARKAAFARRKQAFDSQRPGASGHLAEVLAGYRGVPLAGYMPIRTEIDPLPVMSEAAAHGPVGVPVIQGAGQPLKFSRWTPDGLLRDGPFGAKVPEVDDYFEPEILIVPLVSFDRQGNRLGYGGGFYDRTLELLRSKRSTMAIGFAFGAQEAGVLPLEPTDQPLDMIVTETAILEF